MSINLSFNADKVIIFALIRILGGAKFTAPLFVFFTQIVLTKTSFAYKSLAPNRQFRQFSATEAYSSELHKTFFKKP
jgi:hypothetical protein